MKRSKALQIAIFYALFAGIWILVSDQMSLLVSDYFPPPIRPYLQTLKGGLFCRHHMRPALSSDQKGGRPVETCRNPTQREPGHRQRQPHDRLPVAKCSPMAGRDDIGECHGDPSAMPRRSLPAKRLHTPKWSIPMTWSASARRSSKTSRVLKPRCLRPKLPYHHQRGRY